MCDNKKLDTILFNTTHISFVPYPLIQLDKIISDFNELNDFQKELFIITIIERKELYNSLLSLIHHSNNKEKWYIETQLNHKYNLKFTYLFK